MPGSEADLPGDALSPSFHGVTDNTREQGGQLNTQQLTEQLLASLENMSDAFCLLDSRQVIQYMNTEAERLLLVDRKTAAGRHFVEQFPDIADSPAYAGVLSAFQRGEAWHGEYYRRPQKLWLNISAFPSGGSLAIYFHSTTGEKNLQRRIAESEERLKYVTEAALDIVWDIDLVNSTCWCSSGVRKFGYDFGDEMIDMESWLSKLHPDDRRANTPGLERTLADPEARHWSIGYRFRTASGKYVQFEDRCYILRDVDGKPIRMIGGSTDVSKRLEMEEQLLQAQRLDSLGQLTGGIAHDFNNLLTVILGNTQLLQYRLQDDGELLQLTNNIDMAATRSATLTRQLLAFSRKQTLQPSPVDINKLLGNLKGMLSRTLGENILIELKPQTVLWPAFVDRSQLEVALLNLCINARDAMPDGGTVSMETANVILDETFTVPNMDVKPGNYVRISITDTGTGIQADVLDHVFEPFFTTKEMGKGTGLGLSMVFGFVKQSEGHINIYSEVAHGTTVRLYLPRSLDTDSAPEPEATVQADVGGSELILLVEDNELVRQFAQKLMELLGYRVLSAGDSRSALALLQSHQDIKLLFTDVVMPGFGGYELAKMAQALQPGLKVLYASGYPQDSLMRNGKLESGVHLLAKPYSKAELATKLREVLG